MRRPLLTIGVLAATILANDNGGSTPQGADYIIHEPAGVVRGLGVEIKLDYGAFVVAELSSDERAFLSEAGISSTPLQHQVQRGEYLVTDPIPAGLSASSSTPYQIVEFDGPINDARKSSLVSLVQSAYEYVPSNAFVVRLSQSQRAAVLASEGVVSVTPYHPAFKLQGGLPTNGNVALRILGFRDSPLGDLESAIRQAGATLDASSTTAPGHAVDVSVDAASIPSLAAIDEVYWIEKAQTLGRFHNERAVSISQGGALSAPYSYPLLTGGINASSQTVSVCDTGFSNKVASSGPPKIVWFNHRQYNDSNDGRVEYNRHLNPTPVSLPHHRKVALFYSPVEGGVVQGDTEPTGDHGTHVAGTLAGDVPSSSGAYGGYEEFDGIAPMARVALCDMYIHTPPVTGPQLLQNYFNYWWPARDVGANISTNSWGTDPGNPSYTDVSRQHDLFAWQNRTFIIVRTMGNVGTDVAMVTEAVAKNVLSVGASENKEVTSANCISSGDPEAMWADSIHGPTQDGRRKPNVVAPGALVKSAVPPNGGVEYWTNCGTSMAAPQVAGAAALVRDYFAKGFYPNGTATPSDSRDPTSALVRGVLMASAHELANETSPTYPNSVQGWGRIRVDDGLFFSGESHKLLVRDEGIALTTGDSTEVRVRVLSSSDALRVMLVWTDYPGTVGAAAALVNNLDLRVNYTGALGRNVVYIGNNFNPAGNETIAGAGTADALNVEEAVFINQPSASVYTVRVTGTSVPTGPQKFALVVTGAIEWA